MTTIKKAGELGIILLMGAAGYTTAFCSGVAGILYAEDEEYQLIENAKNAEKDAEYWINIRKDTQATCYYTDFATRDLYCVGTPETIEERAKSYEILGPATTNYPCYEYFREIPALQCVYPIIENEVTITWKEGGFTQYYTEEFDWEGTCSITPVPYEQELQKARETEQQCYFKLRVLENRQTVPIDINCSSGFQSFEENTATID